MIRNRLTRFSIVVAGTIGLLTGCSKSSDAQRSTSPSQPAPVLKFHWLGKTRLAAEANATNFLAIWNLPESAKLEAQTLDKLATAPWRLGATNVALSNAPTALLRPLLDDLVQQEVYVEVSGATNRAAELVLAIRLPADRAAFWETNLSQVWQSLTVAFPRLANFGSQPGFRHTNDWVLLLFSPSTTNARSTNIFDDFLSRISTLQSPSVPSGATQLIQADIDWARLKSFSSLESTVMVGSPRISVTVQAEAGALRSTVDLIYPQSLTLAFRSWNIPTNLIYDPLIAFTAVRGMAEWSPLIGVNPPPNAGKLPEQIFSWAVAGYPLQTYCAFPQPEATNVIRLVSTAVKDKLSQPEQRGFPGRLVTQTNFEQVEIQGFPFMEPRLHRASGSGGEFILGGFIPSMRTNKPIPGELIAQIVAKTNLLYYDWEITGPRVEAWIYIGQTLRLIFRRAQLPSDSAGLKWLQALMPHVGNSATALSAPASNQLSFVRTSTIGFTGLELHLLADWLESPTFPRGYHTERPQPARTTPALPGKK